MTAGGMPPIDLSPDDLKALIAYVEKPQIHSFSEEQEPVSGIF